ncbi:MAG: DMT family transporter [Alicyclobacillus herbarius]|uniref:DMT family transporter n=1 Tax=Alicyclobacillus herbarius TaxID=122960 RepID=UPI0004056BCC|nr:DMT family transporter [Alicyclobacillus herbarius]MCL6632282.1 DMT family transporter [Alicyclobacillus herbarius]
MAIDVSRLRSRALGHDALKTRLGMLYALLAGPALGIALGLLGTLVGKAPFNHQYPTGALAIVVLLQYPFGLLAITIFVVITGAWRDVLSIFHSRISWWTLFVGVGGFVGDLCYACSAVLIGSALAGPIGGLFGVVGALIVAALYKENIKRWSTAIGLLCVAAGIWLVLSGGKLVSPTHGVYELVGVLIMIFGTLTWGFENFAIAAGTDLMRAESFIWWRAALAYLIGFLLMILCFPASRAMTVQVYTDPRMLAYGAVIGFGWAIWIIMGYYIGIAYAGGVRGGVMAGTFGFFFISFLSMTVYGAPFSWIIILGCLVLFVGAVLIITEPKEVLAKKR